MSLDVLRVADLPPGIAALLDRQPTADVLYVRETLMSDEAATVLSQVWNWLLDHLPVSTPHPCAGGHGARTAADSA